MNDEKIALGVPLTLEEMWKTGYNADYIIICEDAIIRCHRAILSAGSSYFKRHFNDAPWDNSSMLLGTKLSDMKVLLKFCYTGQLDCKPKQRGSVLRTGASLQINGLPKPTSTRPRVAFTHAVLPLTYASANGYQIKAEMVEGNRVRVFFAPAASSPDPLASSKGAGTSDRTSLNDKVATTPTTGPKNASVATRPKNVSMAAGPKKASMAAGSKNASTATGTKNVSMAAGPKKASMAAGSKKASTAAGSKKASTAAGPVLMDEDKFFADYYDAEVAAAAAEIGALSVKLGIRCVDLITAAFQLLELIHRHSPENTGRIPTVA